MTSGAGRATRKIGKRFVVESMSAAFPCGGIHHTHHIHHMPTARIADARMGARKTRRHARIFGHPKSPWKAPSPAPVRKCPPKAGAHLGFIRLITVIVPVVATANADRRSGRNEFALPQP